MSKKEERVIVIITILAVLVLIGGMIYGLWQYSLCRPEVSDNFWYCVQHAWGN